MQVSSQLAFFNIIYCIYEQQDTSFKLRIAGISMFRKWVRALQGAAGVVQLLPFSPLRWRAVLWLTAGDLSPFFHLKEPTAWIGGVLSPWSQV